MNKHIFRQLVILLLFLIVIIISKNIIHVRELKILSSVLLSSIYFLTYLNNLYIVLFGKIVTKNLIDYYITKNIFYNNTDYHSNDPEVEVSSYNLYEIRKYTKFKKISNNIIFIDDLAYFKVTISRTIDEYIKQKNIEIEKKKKKRVLNNWDGSIDDISERNNNINKVLK